LILTSIAFISNNLIISKSSEAEEYSLQENSKLFLQIAFWTNLILFTMDSVFFVLAWFTTCSYVSKDDNKNSNEEDKFVDPENGNKINNIEFSELMKVFDSD